MCRWYTTCPPCLLQLTMSRKPFSAMPSLLRDVARHDEHVAERALVLVAHVVDGGDGLVRNDEHVHRRLRTDVAEGGDAVVLVHDGGGNFTRR